MKLKPLHGWAVIQTSQGTEMTVGGVLVLDPANGTPQEGVVEAIGLGAYEVEKRGKEKEERKKLSGQIYFKEAAGASHLNMIVLISKAVKKQMLG